MRRRRRSPQSKNKFPKYLRHGARGGELDLSFPIAFYDNYDFDTHYYTKKKRRDSKCICFELFFLSFSCGNVARSTALDFATCSYKNMATVVLLSYRDSSSNTWLPRKKNAEKTSLPPTISKIRYRCRPIIVGLLVPQLNRPVQTPRTRTRLNFKFPTPTDHFPPKKIVMKNNNSNLISNLPPSQGHTLFQTHDNREHLAMMEKILDAPVPESMVKR